MAERLEKGIIIKKEKINLVNGRSNTSNWRKARCIEDGRRDQGERGTTEYNIKATVRTEEGGGESRGQSKEGNRGGIIQTVRRGLRKEVDI